MSTETPKTDALFPLPGSILWDEYYEEHEYRRTLGAELAKAVLHARNLELENARLAGEVARLTGERDEAMAQLAQIVVKTLTPEQRERAIALGWHYAGLRSGDGDCRMWKRGNSMISETQLVLDSSVNPPHPAPPNGIF